MSEPLRFALIGAGFWARFQLAGWQELDGVECVAVCDPVRERAEALAREYGIPSVHEAAEELLQKETLDFVDIVTPVETHEPLVLLAAAQTLPVICQKPMAPSLEAAEAMVAACRNAGTPFFVHENWRWQRPLRQLKQVLSEGRIGHPFRARIQFSNSFPVFDNQPFLAELEQFILTDIGSHILDTARFLFGEVSALYCRTQRIHRHIRGEDVATVLMTMGEGMSVVCEMSYASRLENERFPQTYVVVEGETGSVELGPDYQVRVTTENGTHARRYPPPRHAWADPAYDLVQASIVPCNANLLAALRGQGAAETTASDNLETVRLVFAAYESARAGRVVDPRRFAPGKNHEQ